MATGRRGRTASDWRAQGGQYEYRVLTIPALDQPQRRAPAAHRARPSTAAGSSPAPLLFAGRRAQGVAAAQDHPGAQHARPEPTAPRGSERASAGRAAAGPAPATPNCSASTGTRSSTPWNIAGEVEVGGQPQRREAVAGDAQPGRATCCPCRRRACTAARSRPGPRRAATSTMRVDQVAARTGTSSAMSWWIVLDPHVRRRRARASVRANSSSWPGQEPAVDASPRRGRG